MKNEKNFWDILLPKLWLGLGGFMVLLCIIMLASTRGHCASEQDYFPMYQNNNGKFSADLLSAIGTRFDSANNYVFVKFDNFNPSSGYGRYNYYVLWFAKGQNGMFYAEKYNNLYQFSLYSIGSVNYNQGSFWCDARQPNVIASYSGYSNTPGAWMSDMISNNYSSTYDYVSNFQLMTNNTSSAQIVLLYDDGVSIPDGDTARDDMEIPNITDYIPNWTNPPSFDSSSVENALQSVYNGIVWLGGNIKDTITGTGKYIGDVVRWGLQRVIDTIRDKINDIKGAITDKLTAIQGFISDVKGYVYEVKQYIEYIKEPVNLSAVGNTITTSTMYTDLTGFNTSFTTFKAVFDNASEPGSYTIPLHLENIPILHTTQQTFDLGVILPVRPLIRAFCWTITTFTLFITVLDALPNYINGGGDE